MKKAKILFLHSELAKYFIACVKELSKSADVHVIHWPVNSEAPFKFENVDGVRFYLKDHFSPKELEDLLSSIDPDIVVVSGWRDKEYLKVIQSAKKGSIKVMTLDNPWKGSIKQRLWTLASRKKLLPLLSHCWVAGKRQRVYALKLGFKNENIIDDLYSADNDHFDRIYLDKKKRSLEKRPKRFIFIGRYSKEKGIDTLFESFKAFSSKNKNWELWCLGTGPLFNKRHQHPRIKHFGFVQPENMPEILSGTDVFVLPSSFEPWGLVVHEMVASGFPLILSNQVGASEMFLRQGENGYLIEAGSIEQLKAALLKMSDLSEEQHFAMSKKSYELSKQISTQKWADKVLKLL